MINNIEIHKLLTLILLAISLSLSLMGCANVQPWERGTLAKPQMELEAYPLQSALRQHNYNSREASAIGNTAQGGGCGCN